MGAIEGREVRYGYVTVMPDGTVQGEGDAFDLFNELVAEETFPDHTALPSDYDGTLAEWRADILPFVIRSKEAYARQATAFARWMAKRSR